MGKKDAGFQARFSHLEDMASGLERPNPIIASMYGWFDFCNTFKSDKSSASSAKADQSLF